MNALFEGDIVPDYDSILKNYGVEVVEELKAEGILDSDDKNVHMVNEFILQNVVTDQRWPTRVKDVVQIPYVLDSSFSSNQVSGIRNALKELGSRSQVVRFVPRKNEYDYIYVNDSGGCSSFVGKQGGRQVISLEGYCASRKGIIQHEFIHALGLFHEQSRPDRDDYVKIKWQNIQGGTEHNFRKKEDLSTLGNSYDYGSVMHYPDDAFSSNGSDTISPLKPLDGKVLGQRNEADDQDIVDIRLLYQCVSGPRNLSQYSLNRCTTDCKCWEGEMGCNKKNNACQGTLICRNNKCVDESFGGRTLSPTRNQNSRTSAPTSSRTVPRSKWKQIKNSGDCLSLSKRNGTYVGVWKCYLGNNQKWFYNESSKTIKSRKKNKFCLTRDASGNVKAQSCTGMSNQKWYADEAVRGSLISFRSENGGCLSRNPVNGNVEVDIVCNFARTQQFQIV